MSTSYNRMKSKSVDDFQTPPSALDPLFPYLPLDWKIWEPACGKGNLVNEFRERGYKVYGTDILTGDDFLAPSLACSAAVVEADINSNVIITNPPYSFKTQFIETCYEENRPFALLLPLTALEGIKRQKLYREHGLQLILFNRRVAFATAWFTWGLNLPKDLVFYNEG
jgi:hypothetical protein